MTQRQILIRTGGVNLFTHDIFLLTGGIAEYLFEFDRTVGLV